MTSLLTPLSLEAPPHMLVGPGQIAQLHRWIVARGLRRVLIVADPFNGARIGTLQIGPPATVAVHSDLDHEPNTDDVVRVRAFADDFAPDCVVGFGGGSAMDLAKLAAVLVNQTVSLDDVVGMDRTPARRCALVQVPTTAGTGSEGGPRALIADRHGGKLAVASGQMLADLAVIDPELMASVPARLTASTGVDALAHCAEAFTSSRAHPLIDLYALEGIRLVGQFLERAVRDGADVEARAGLAVASLYGGYCLGPVNTTGGHAIAYPLGTRLHVPHGAAVGAIFPHMLGFNQCASPHKTRLICDALGLDPADCGRSAHRFCAALGLEMHISAFGVDEAQLDEMAQEAFGIRRLLDNNPRPIAKADILQIYRNAL